MARTPSFLKGLAETRARLLADVAASQELADKANAKLAHAQADLAACDLILRKHYPYVDPDGIQPIRAWQGHYGKRGAFRAAMIEYLRSRAPAAVTGPELRDALIGKFRLRFHDRTARHTWWKNTGLPRENHAASAKPPDFCKHPWSSCVLSG